MTSDIYSHVRRYANSGLPSQRMAIALLTAVEDTIKERGVELSPTAYFASFMSLILNRTEDSVQLEDFESILSLLSVVIAHVPVAVMRQKFDSMSSFLVESFEQLTASHSVTRYLIEITRAFIVAQEVATWSTAIMNSLFQVLISHGIDERPKVRRVAQQAITSIMAHPPPPMSHHPGESTLARFLDHALQKKNDENVILHSLQFLKSLWRVFKEPRSIVQLTTAILELKSFTNKFVVVLVFETLVSLFLLMQEKSICDLPINKLEVIFHIMLEMKPNINDTQLLPLWLSIMVHAISVCCRVDNSKSSSLLVKLYENIFALLLVTPATKSVVKIVHQAICQALEFLIKECVSQEMLNESDIASIQPKSGRTLLSPFEQIVARTAKGLSLSHQSGWSVVLDANRFIIEKCCHAPKGLCFRLMKPTLEVLSDDSVYALNENYPHIEKLQRLLGSAIRVCGPADFLSVFSLNINLDKQASEEPRTWLLPLLKDNIANTDMAYFLKELLPLSQRIAERGGELLSAGKETEGKKCAIIWAQIWDLMPGFCHAATDLQETFEPLCKIVVPMMFSNDDRILSICEALRVFVNVNSSIVHSGKMDRHMLPYSVSAEQAQENLNFLSKYAEHILPPLFSKYVELNNTDLDNVNLNVSQGQLKNAILETIRSWIGIAESDVINQFLNSTVQKYTAGEENGMMDVDDANLRGMRHALLDLALSIIASKRLAVESLEPLIQVLKVGIYHSTDFTIQKKSYKAWALIFRSALDATDDKSSPVELQKLYIYNLQFLEEMTEMILDTTAIVGNAAKKDRLNLIQMVITAFPHAINSIDQGAILSFIPTILSEAILATKETNEKARNISYDVIISAGNTMHLLNEKFDGKLLIALPVEDEQSDSENENDENSLSYKPVANLNELVKMVVAGLAGKTPHMISATIHSLARLMYEFKEADKIDLDFKKSIIQTVLVYVRDSRCREIIKAAISFIKVVIVVCADIIQPMTIAQDQIVDDDVGASYNYLGSIVAALLRWSSEHKSHFRSQSRYILERLIRKFGFDAVSKYFPEEHKKLLNNIRKCRERKAKRQSKEQTGTEKEKFQSFHELMEARDSDDEEENLAVSDEEELPEMLRELVNTTISRKKREGADRLQIKENMEDEPLDFLDRKAVGSIYATTTGKAKKRANESYKHADQNGKMVFGESDEEDSQITPLDSNTIALQTANRHYMESITSKDAFKYSADGKKVKFASNKKRSRNDDLVDDYEKDELDMNEGRSEKKEDKRSKKRRMTEREMKRVGIKHTGQEYRGKKGKGDIKRADQPDPFAYIPLNPKIAVSQKGKKKTVRLNKHLFNV